MNKCKWVLIVFFSFLLMAGCEERGNSGDSTADTTAINVPVDGFSNDPDLTEILYGTWKVMDAKETRENTGKYMKWKARVGNKTMGWVYQLENGDTVGVQNLTIEPGEEGLMLYWGDENRPEEDQFRLAEYENGELFFKNEIRQYPQNIIYQPMSNMELRVFYGGFIDGEPAEETLIYINEKNNNNSGGK